MWIQQIGKLRMLFYKKSKLVFYFSDKIGLMYHFHAAEKSAHAFWQVARKHVNTQYVVY